jgi:hypothetical protein
MQTKDLFIAPVVIILVYAIALWVRPMVTERMNRRYFFPALTVKIFGGLALGFIYQFYYGGGDTFTYFDSGSKYIWLAFQDNPFLALKLILAGNDYVGDTFQYASKIYSYGDSSSYFVVRVAGVFGILTAHSYAAVAVLFASASFSGVWALYHVFFRMYPKLHFKLALAIFFIPSLVFWGSGVLKDSITLGALGWVTFCIYYIFIERKYVLVSVLILFMTLFTIYTIKVYILLCFLPSVILWISYLPMVKLKNAMLKIMVAPLVLALAGLVAYYTTIKVAEDNPRYNIETITRTAEETARWIYYVSQRDQGSAYDLGDFDYSPAGIVRKFPMAVWVTLFRPYLWESHNIVMFFSAVESFALLLFTMFVLFRVGLQRSMASITSNPLLAFCFLFAIVFSFAVGLTTYNFGTLVRYKIPMYPYFVSGLVILWSYAKSDRKRRVLAFSE